MASVNTNAAAITALRTLQNTNASLDKTQSRISTGYKIGEAKDNAAYWAISTTLKSDNKSLSTVKDALGLGSSTVDVAYQGLNKAKDVLDEIKSKLTAATQDGVNRNTIQDEITQLQDQLKSIATSSVFSGENWLSIDSSGFGFNPEKQVVASFSRDTGGSVSIGTIKVQTAKVALFDSSSAADTGGILDGAVNLKGRDGRDLSIGGTAVTTGNGSDAGLSTAATNAAGGGVTNGAASGGTATAGIANKATAVATGVNSVAAKGVASGTGTLGAGYAAGDYLNLAVTIDGTSVTLDRMSLAQANGKVAADGAFTVQNVVDYLNSQSAFSSVATAKIGDSGTTDAGKLVITTKPRTDSTQPRVAVTANVYNGTSGTSASANAGTAAPAFSTGLNIAASGSAVGVAAQQKVITTGAIATLPGSPALLADGDKLTFNIDVNGVSKSLTVTYKGTPVAAGEFSTGADLAAALTAQASAQAIADLTIGGNATGITFTSGYGATKTLKLTDVTLSDSSNHRRDLGTLVASGTGDSAFTASTRGTVQTGAISFADLQPTDKVTFNLSVDGSKLAPVSVAAGANIDDLVVAINASALKSSVVASKSGSALVLKSVSGGATSSVSIDSVAFNGADGAKKTIGTTGFNNVAYSGTAKTAAFAGPVTLDKDDNIYFNIQAGTATSSKLVTIDKDLVNKTLAVTTGTIGNAADFKKVVDAALTAQKVAGVTTSLTGLNELVFTTDGVGADAKLSVTGAKASQGGSTISVDKMDISDDAFSALTSDQVKEVLSAYIDVVNSAINKVTDAAAALGSVASRIDMQKSFVDTLMDTIDKGVGTLIDADMSEESTKLQALQVKQQLGTQSLSIANQSAQNILSLFQTN